MKNALKKIETTQLGLNLYFETYGIFIPFVVERPTWDKAKEIAAERGHALLSLEQGASVIENAVEINKALEEAGKPTFDDWFWLDREHSTDPRCAWLVYMNGGDVSYGSKDTTYYVRAVSAFPIE